MLKLILKGGKSRKRFFLQEDEKKIALIEKEEYISKENYYTGTIYLVKIYDETEREKVTSYIHENITDRFYWI